MVRSTVVVVRGIQVGIMLGILAFAGLDGLVGLCGGDDLALMCVVAKGGGLALGGAVLGAIFGAVVASRTD